jgi:hypothetical protein
MSGGRPEKIKGTSATFSHYIDSTGAGNAQKIVGAQPKSGGKWLSLNSLLRRLG